MGRLKKISKYTPSILQERLDFSAARKSFSLTAAHPYESTILHTLVLALLVLVCGYLYFVGSSILHIVARKESIAQTSELQSRLAVLEREYFALSHRVDESTAIEMGLAAAKTTQFVHEPSTAVAATIPGNGI